MTIPNKTAATPHRIWAGAMRLMVLFQCSGTLWRMVRTSRIARKRIEKLSVFYREGEHEIVTIS